jgi:hypothetical protein
VTEYPFQSDAPLLNVPVPACSGKSESVPMKLYEMAASPLITPSVSSESLSVVNAASPGVATVTLRKSEPPLLLHGSIWMVGVVDKCRPVSELIGARAIGRVDDRNRRRAGCCPESKVTVQPWVAPHKSI